VVVPWPDPPPPQPANWHKASAEAAQMKNFTQASAIEEPPFIAGTGGMLRKAHRARAGQARRFVNT
jgi:hypothetical protein